MVQFFSRESLKKTLSFIEDSVEYMISQTLLFCDEFLQNISEYKLSFQKHVEALYSTLADNETMRRQLHNNIYPDTQKQSDANTVYNFQKSVPSIISRATNTSFSGIIRVFGSFLSPSSKQESQQNDIGLMSLSQYVARQVSNKRPAVIQAQESASVKSGIGLEKAVYHLVGVSAEIQFSGEATDRGKFSDKDLSTDHLSRYLEALKICQTFLPAIMNQRLGNASQVLSSIPVPLPSENQESLAVDQETKPQVKKPSEAKWYDSDEKECKQDESRKQHRHRRVGDIPMHKSLVDTDIKVHTYDGEKRIKDPSKHYAVNHQLSDQ